MEEKQITVVLVKSGQKPEVTYIPNDLPYFEKLVDGPASVERFFISGYRLVCSVDEGFGYEGRRLPTGTYFIAKYHTFFEDMSREEAGEIKRMLMARSRQRKRKGLLSIFSK